MPSKFKVPFIREVRADFDGMSPPVIQVVWFGYISQIHIEEGEGDLFVPWFEYYLSPWLPEGGGDTVFIHASWWAIISFY